MNVMDDDGFVADPIEFHACDRCGARSYIFATINGVELGYCGSHGRDYLPKLRTLGVVIIDMRHSIPT